MAVSLYEETIFSEQNTQIGADKVTDIFFMYFTGFPGMESGMQNNFQNGISYKCFRST